MKDERRITARKVARFARLVPGVGPAMVRAARALGVLKPYTPAAFYATEPIEQARLVERDQETALVAAAIALTLRLDHASIHEPRVLTLRTDPRPYSVWWQSRLSPSSLPPRRVGPPARSEVLRMPEPTSTPVPPAGGPAPRGGR